MSPTRTRSRLSVLLWVLSCALAPALQAGQADLSTSQQIVDTLRSYRMMAASDGAHLWYLRPAEPIAGQAQPGLLLMHHGPEMNRDEAVNVLRGVPMPAAMAAANERIYFVYDLPPPSNDLTEAPRETRPDPAASRRTVKMVRAFYEPVMERYVYDPAAALQVVAGLPGWGTLVDFHADSIGPIALLRGVDASDLTDTFLEEQRPSLNTRETLDAMLSGRDSDQTPPPAAQPQTPDPSPQPGGPQWLLAQLDLNVWRALPLPATVTDDADLRLLPGSRPQLAVAGPGTGGETIIYTYDPDDGWSTRNRLPGLTPGGIADAADVQGMLLLGESDESGGPLRLSLLHRDTLRPLTTLSDIGPYRRMVNFHGDLGVVHQRSPADDVRIVLVDPYTGSVNEAIVPRQPSYLTTDDFRPLILAGALLIATLVMFLFRPDHRQRLTLPPDTRLAEPMRRLAATAIDFIPAALVSKAILSVPTEELFNWPLVRRSFEDILPSLLAIGLCLLHSTITEMIAGTSLGKAITGCRVLSLEGKPPTVVQSLLRNSLKLLAMIVPPLAIFVFMNPYRQLLGDLVARTVVVVRAEFGQEPPSADDSPDDAQ